MSEKEMKKSLPLGFVMSYSDIATTIAMFKSKLSKQQIVNRVQSIPGYEQVSTYEDAIKYAEQYVANGGSIEFFFDSDLPVPDVGCNQEEIETLI